MICNYRYKGIQYSEGEIRRLLGDEFFNNEMREIRELEEIGRPGIGLSILRNATAKSIFGSDIDSQLLAQERIHNLIGDEIYIGSHESPFFLAKQRNVEIENLKNPIYVPETLEIGIQKLYNELKEFLEEYENDSEMQEDQELTEMYRAISYLKNFNDFKKFMHDLYPESMGLIDNASRDIDVELERDQEGNLQTIYTDIQDEEKKDREKSQSKYVKFFTSFVEYDVIINEDGSIDYSIIKDPGFVYSTLLSSLGNPVDTSNIVDQIQEAFKLLIDINATDEQQRNESIKVKKQRAVYEKILGLATSLDVLYDDINIHEVLNKMRFDTENSFIFDKTLNTDTFNLYNAQLDSKNHQRINREGLDSKKVIETTPRFLSKIQEIIKNETGQEVSLKDLSKLWLYHYNKSVLTDIISLMVSQRDTNPVKSTTEGKYGQIKTVAKPASKIKSAISVRTTLFNNMADFFETKERIQNFTEGETWKNILKKLRDSKNVKNQKEGIKEFISVVGSQNFNHTIALTPAAANETAQNIQYLVETHLRAVNLSEQDISEAVSEQEQIAKEDTVNKKDIVKEKKKALVNADDIIRDNANSLLNVLADLVEADGVTNIVGSARAADNTSFYPHHNGSTTENIHDILNLISKANTGYKGKLNPGLFNRKLPDHLTPQVLSLNPIANGLIKMGKTLLHKGNLFYNIPKMYSRENINNWFMREFSEGFITQIKQSSTNNIRYHWFYPPISNKPNVKGVEVTVASASELRKSIYNIFASIITRPDELDGAIKNYNKNNLTLFNVAKQFYKPNSKSIQSLRKDIIDNNYDLNKISQTSQIQLSEISNGIFEELLNMSIESAQEFVVDNELYISKDIETVSSRLKNFLDNTYISKLTSLMEDKGLVGKKSDLSAAISEFNYGEKVTDEGTGKKQKKYDLSVKDFISIYSLYYLNNYINTFAIPQLTVGDGVFFKDENDFIKRLSIAFSPGTSLMVNKHGSKPLARIMVMKEVTTAEGRKGLKEFVSRLLEGASQEEIDIAVKQFSDEGFDRADAQGFMLDTRLEDIQRGSGPSYAQGTAVKPVVHTFREVRVNRNDPTLNKKINEIQNEVDLLSEKESLTNKDRSEIAKLENEIRDLKEQNTFVQYIPTSIKYASFALTQDSYLMKYPKVKAMRQFMIDNQIDEVVFKSGVKVGAPSDNNLFSLDEVINMVGSQSHRQYGPEVMPNLENIQKLGDKSFSIMNINNSDYRLQQNPNTNKQFEKQINNPTQITYVLNIASKAKPENAQEVYNSLSSIMRIQSKDIVDALSQKNISTEYLTNSLRKKLKGQLNELFLQFLEAGLDINFPAFLQKAVIQFSSFVSDEILSTPFEGGKFQIVSDVLFEDKKGNDLEVKRDLQTGQIYAEVYVPRRFKDKLPINSDLIIDGFSVRIPSSGFHSAIPLKIVGYVDTDSDVLVVPKEITPIQGSDFDADSLFLIRRQTWYDFKNRFLRKMPKGASKQLSDIINREYALLKGENVDAHVYLGYKKGKLQTESEFIKEINGLLEELENVTTEQKSEIKDKFIIAYHKQRIVDLTIETLSDGNKENVKEVISPIQMQLVNGPKDSVYEYIANVRGVDVKSLTKTLDLGRLENKYAYYKRNFDGNALTGIFANLFKAVAYMNKAGEDFQMPSLKSDLFGTITDAETGTEIRDNIVIGENTYTQFNENTTLNGKNVPVRMMMDILINLAIDNVKEQGLPTINASATTASVYVMGISLGISMENMVGLMLSPSAMRISAIKTRDSANAVIRELQEKLGEEVEVNIPITKELLKKQIKISNKPIARLTKQELQEQLAIMGLYKKLEKPANELNDLSINLSVIQDMKVNYKDVEKSVNYFKNKVIPDESFIQIVQTKKDLILFSVHNHQIGSENLKYVSSSFEIPNLVKSAPHIGQAIISQRMMYDYISEAMPIYNKEEPYRNFLAETARMTNMGMNTEERQDNIRKEVLHFFASSSSELSDAYNFTERKRHKKYTNYLLSPIDSWGMSIAEKVIKYQAEEVQKVNKDVNYEPNFFLKALEVDLNKVGGYPFISLSMGRSLKPFHFYRAQEDFKKLPFSLQKDLLKYVIMFYGTKFGTSNFVFAIPPTMYKDFSMEFKNTLNKFLKSEELQGSEFDKIRDFIQIQIVLNNYDSIGSLPSEFINFSKSDNVQLNDGSFVYFDMYHDAQIEPELYQQGEEAKQEQDENQTEDDVSMIDMHYDSDISKDNAHAEAEKEVKTLSKSTKFDFVSTMIYDKENKNNKQYIIYKRINDIPVDLLPPTMKGRTFYQKVANLKRSKYYTVPKELYEDGELVKYSLNEKFNPRLASETIADDTFMKNEDTISIEYFAPRKYIKGQHIILNSSIDNERLHARLYEITDIRDSVKLLGSTPIPIQEVIFTKISDTLPSYEAYEVKDDIDPKIDDVSDDNVQMMAKANNIGLYNEQDGRVPYKNYTLSRNAFMKDIEAGRIPVFHLANTYARQGIEAIIRRSNDVYDGPINTDMRLSFDFLNKRKFEKNYLKKFSQTGKAVYSIINRLIKDDISITIRNVEGYSSRGTRVMGSYEVIKGVQTINIYRHDANDSIEHTLLHELFHAAMDGFTDEYAAYKAGKSHTLSEKEIVAMDNLERLYDIYHKGIPEGTGERFNYNQRLSTTSKSYRLKEFINDALTDPRLLSILNNIQLGEQNVQKPAIIRWIENILEAILDLFNVNNNTVASAALGNIVFLVNHRDPSLALRKSNEIVFKESEQQEEDLSLQKEAIDILKNIQNKFKGLEHDKNTTGEEISAYTFDGVTGRGLTDVINYDFRGFKKDYDIVANIADRLWQGRDKSVKLDMTQEGIQGEITYDEFVEEKKKKFMNDAARGQIIHYEFQMLINPEMRSVLSEKQEQLILEHNFDGISFDWIAGIYEKYANRMQFTKNTHNVAEMPIFNKDLKLGTTIDHFIVYEDGTFGINDWKSGSSFQRRNSGVKIKFGDQIIDISNDSMSAAKIQVMFGAFLFKLEHPDARFKNLSVTWVNNSRYQASKDNSSMIDIPSYLGAIKDWLASNPDSEIKKWYEDNKNHKAFNPSSYIGYTNEFSNKTLADNFDVHSAEKALDSEILSLVMRSSPRKPEIFGQNRKEQLARKTFERLQLEAGGDIFTARDNEPRADDLSIISRYFASYEDIDNPYLNTFKKILDQKMHKTRREQRTELNKIQSLLKPVYRDWLRKQGKTFQHDLFKNRLTKVSPFKADGSGLYNFAWTVEIKNGLEIPTLIHPVKHKAEWEKRNLTENQKNLLKYFHEKVHHYLNPNDPNALMNRVVTTSEKGKELTNFDILKRRFNASTMIPYEEGMTPRYFMPMKEAIDRFGWTNPKTWQMLYDKYLTFRVEQSWEEWANVEEIIPVKGIPTTNNTQSEMFTYNVEVIFDKFIRNMTMKDNLDTVYATGQGIITYLKMKESKDATKSYKNTISFLEDKLLLDILNETKVQDFSRKNINIPTIMLGKNVDQENVKGIQGFSVHKLISSLRSLSAASIMWLQPVNGIRNAVFISMINSKDAIRNSILEKGFKGIDGNEIDFTMKDLAFAHVQVMNMYKDSMVGNVRRNKVYIMGKKLDYLPDNFDWASRENELLTSSNNLIEQGTMYMFHTIPEEGIALMLMVAQLNRMKNPNTGKSIWESYGQPTDIGNGVYDVFWEGGVRGIVRTGQREVELTELDGLEVRRLKRVYQRMHGNYRREERVAAEAYLMGQIFMQFRKYLPAILFAAWGSKRADQTLGYYKFTGDEKNGKQVMEWEARIIEGRFRVLGYWLMENLNLAGNNAGKYKWENLSTDQKAQLIDFGVTTAYFAMLMSAIYMIFGPDDDKDSVKMWLEIIAQNMSQHWNVLDQARSLEMTPATFKKTYDLTESSMTMFWSLMLLSTGDSESAMTQKGHLKGYTKFRKSVPILNSVYNAQRFIENTDVFGEDAGAGFDFYRTR